MDWYKTKLDLSFRPGENCDSVQAYTGFTPAANMVKSSGVPTLSAILVQLQSWWKLGQCPGIYQISHCQYLYASHAVLPGNHDFPGDYSPGENLDSVQAYTGFTTAVNLCGRGGKMVLFSVSAGLQSWWKLGQCPGIYQIFRRALMEDSLPYRKPQNDCGSFHQT